MIFVFGNGLSIGFDSRLTTTGITERVVASLSESTRMRCGISPRSGLLRIPIPPLWTSTVERSSSSRDPSTDWRMHSWPCSASSSGRARARYWPSSVTRPTDFGSTTCES